MTNLNLNLNLEDFEIITAITTTYQEDIERFLLEEDDEIIQEDFANVVMSLYTAYIEDTTPYSLLDLINNKFIKINEVY